MTKAIAIGFLFLLVGCGEPCEDRAVDDCESDSECAAISARPVDAERMCLGSSQPVGCIARGTGCGDALTSATDPEGSPWRFTSTCVPKGWGRAGSAGVVADWPKCATQ